MKENNYYLLNDRVVKKLFTNGSKASKEFIFLIISYVTKIPFADLEKNFEFIHPQIGINKNIINSEADVVIETDNAYYSFEFNYGNYYGLSQKNFSYVCILYLRQINNNKDYKLLKNVYSINFDSFDYFHVNRLIYRSEMLETELYKKRNLKVVYIDINLEYLRRLDYNEIKKKDAFTKALYIFVCNDEEFLTELYEGDEFMKELRKQADKIVQDFDLLMYYDKDKLDQEVVFNNGFDKGHDSGFNEGHTSGFNEGLIATAKKMIKMNLDLKTIAKATGLKPSEIQKLI